MRVCRGIGMNVMQPMQTHPLNRTSLAGEGPQEHQSIFKPFRGSKAPMAHQSMKTEVYAQASCCPVEEGSNTYRPPREVAGKEGEKAGHVEDGEISDGPPIRAGGVQDLRRIPEQ